MFKKVFLAGFALASFFVATVPASAATLAIKGSIVPGACSLNLDGGGAVSYGELTVQQVTDFGGNDLAYAAPEKSIGMKIKCEAPSKISVSLADNRGPTKFDIGDADDAFGYGLGEAAAGKNIGQYRIDFSKLLGTHEKGGTLETPSAYFVQWSDLPDRSFVTATGSAARYFDPKKDVGFQFTNGGGGVPNRISVVEGSLGIQAFFSRDVVDNSGQLIKLDGSSTFTIHYH